MGTSVKRTRAHSRGVFAESLVAFLFHLKGYRIVAQRCRSPVGVIDLVAPKVKRLVFVEVKRRTALDDSAWTVPPKQKRRIVRASQYCLASYPNFTTYTIPFDVVLAAPWA